MPTQTDPTLTATTTRPVTFVENTADGHSITRRLPAGTHITVTRVTTGGMCLARVRGTRLTQRINIFTDINPC